MSALSCPGDLRRPGLVADVIPTTPSSIPRAARGAKRCSDLSKGLLRNRGRGSRGFRKTRSSTYTAGTTSSSCSVQERLRERCARSCRPPRCLAALARAASTTRTLIACRATRRRWRAGAASYRRRRRRKETNWVGVNEDHAKADHQRLVWSRRRRQAAVNRDGGAYATDGAGYLAIVI